LTGRSPAYRRDGRPEIGTSTVSPDRRAPPPAAGRSQAEEAQERPEEARTRVEADIHGAEETLSTQELRIARLAPQGCPSGRSGERLVLSPRSVDSRLCRISLKLSIPSRSELSSGIDVN